MLKMVVEAPEGGGALKFAMLVHIDLCVNKEI